MKANGLCQARFESCTPLNFSSVLVIKERILYASTVMSQRLSSLTRNQIGSAGDGKNPTRCGAYLKVLDISHTNGE